VAYLECAKGGPGCLWDGSPPVVSRVKTLAVGVWDEVPQKLKLIC